MIQAQKITRLEASLKVYEDEIRRLTEKVIELEEQILTLEHKNGRLIMDSNQNVSLKFKIQKLQEGNCYVSLGGPLIGAYIRVPRQYYMGIQLFQKKGTLDLIMM